MKKKAVIKNKMAKKIIGYEVLGFVIFMFLLWSDEIFDIPHIFGAPATPINWIECLFENAYVLFLCTFILLATWKCLKRIKHLEGFLRVCSFCKKIRVGDEWIPIEVYIQNNSETQFSHGLCSQCMEKHYGVITDD